MSAKLRANRLTHDSVCGSFYFPSYSAAADEAEVAGILFRLPDLIQKLETKHRFPPCWGAKRRRSFPPELFPVNGKLEYVVSRSPTSPLTFSSHTDLDSNQQLAPKEEEKEWLKNCGRSIECRAQFKVNEVASSVEVKLISHSQPLVHRHQHDLEFRQVMGPRGIPDLNVPVEDYAIEMEWPQQQVPYYITGAVESRAEAAAMARQRRHLIQKSKRATRGAR